MADTAPTKIESPNVINKVEVISDRPDCATFIFVDEDHTLGNALHYVLMKNPKVDFSGYSIPHPSDNKMNLRIQTKGNTTAQDAIMNGLSDIKDISQSVDERIGEESNQSHIYSDAQLCHRHDGHPTNRLF
ncbi:putative RNA polymerase III subunit [Heterostelium album PN500]|uniref:Putative RNA polymerase III subunit n=1 Tax=Heterostelium pallidum (strain ATCC 26659 / Pp 5 / PN500) TaxID=670386 RepID=D3BVK7_HETP5|nr:putative RNA polymerase III subunit [Heterostelium album PN500]EFA74510.1 putative RNA polymerase III subunit [Heterostelium album PN500]|eukprot:XP_020426644.1 putative RNA polymerase III subunit [Heterostelium album PN500]